MERAEQGVNCDFATVGQLLRRDRSRAAMAPALPPQRTACGKNQQVSLMIKDRGVAAYTACDTSGIPDIRIFCIGKEENGMPDDVRTTSRPRIDIASVR